jgi:hypothetical protein
MPEQIDRARESVIRAAQMLNAVHPSWCRPEPDGCSCALTDLERALARLERLERKEKERGIRH